MAHGRARRSSTRRAWTLGRDVRFASRVAEETGVQLVMCTGIYTYALPSPLLPEPRRGLPSPTPSCTTSRWASRAPRSRPAFIKCAADEPGITPDVEKVHRAARARQRADRARRSWPTRGRPAGPGLEQMRIFDEEGVDPRKVQIAHTGDTDDLDYIEELLAHGPSTSGWTATGSTSSCPTRSATRRSPSSAGAATPSACSSRRTPARRSTGSPRRWSPSWRRTGT